MNAPLIEACVDSYASCKAAWRGGADRLELCAHLVIGGTTPSAALFRQVQRDIPLKTNVLIRPRFGDFLYSKEELEQMIHEGRWKEFIREIPIKPGDFIQIDPGTVHAIKGGTLLLETQQSSDITYRVYDYDRLSNGKPRQLHIAQSIDVITVPAKSAENSVVHTEEKEDAIQQLIRCPYYTVYRIDVEHRVETWQDKPFVLMSVVEGEGTLNGTHLKKGDHLILPDGYGKVELQGRMKIIASTI